MKKTQLTKAFSDLRKIGYLARQNFSCCQSCAWAEIPDDKSERAVFYHRQDHMGMRETGEVYLSWAGNGHEIVNVLKSNGLSVEWDGTPSRRIRVII